MENITNPDVDMYYEYMSQYPLNGNFRLIEITRPESGGCAVKMEILYKKNFLHIISLTEKDDDFFWEILPYNGDVFCRRALHPDTFESVLQAVEEHSDLHLKRYILDNN